MLDEEYVTDNSNVGSNSTDVNNSSNNSTSHYRDLVKKLDGYNSIYNDSFLITTNNVARRFWKKGHTRPQLLGFFADKEISAEYIGFVDSDCQVITYVD